MKQHLLISFISIVLLVSLAACAPIAPETAGAQSEPAVGITDEGPEHHLLYAPGDIEWQDGPGSLETV
jgi:hypothetical protein